MAKFIYFTPEEKARAQNTDLVSLLRAQGERPIRSGREYRIPHTFWEISKIFAAMAGVSRIGVKNWVDGRVDGGLLGKPASPCAPGVSAGRHRVDILVLFKNRLCKTEKNAVFEEGMKLFRFL